MLTPENSQTGIMQRQSEYLPPRSLSHRFIGRPLQTADAPHQTIGKLIGLAVFATDALSSAAYASLGVSQFIPSKRWHKALHMRTADFLRQELLSKPGVVVTDVPYYVYNENEEEKE
jgi:hypothetical protein